MSRIGVVISSTRPNRIGPQVAEWVAAQAPEGVDAEIVDLAEVDLPFLAEPQQPSQGDYQVETTQAWAQQVRGFDGLILTVAEYNGGPTAVLKNAIDSLYAEWDGLPVGVVSYGYGGGARAATALEPVLGTVKAERIEGPQLTFDQDLSAAGDILEAAPAADVRSLFDQITAKARSAAA